MFNIFTGHPSQPEDAMDLQPSPQASRASRTYICFKEIARFGQGTRILPDQRRISPGLLEATQHPLHPAQTLNRRLLFCFSGCILLELCACSIHLLGPICKSFHYSIIILRIILKLFSKILSQTVPVRK